MDDIISRPALMASLAAAHSHLMEGEDMVGRMYGEYIFREVERIVREAPSQAMQTEKYQEDEDRESGLFEED